MASLRLTRMLPSLLLSQMALHLMDKHWMDKESWWLSKMLPRINRWARISASGLEATSGNLVPILWLTRSIR